MVVLRFEISDLNLNLQSEISNQRDEQREQAGMNGPALALFSSDTPLPNPVKNLLVQRLARLFQ
jgi:hypothetical protein